MCCCWSCWASVYTLEMLVVSVTSFHNVAVMHHVKDSICLNNKHIPTLSKWLESLKVLEMRQRWSSGRLMHVEVCSHQSKPCWDTVRQSWAKVRKHRDILFFKTTRSPPAPAVISLSDLTDVCQCCHASRLSVNGSPRAFTLSISSASSSHSNAWKAPFRLHLSQGVWIMPNLATAKVFLQEIVSLQYGLVNDRRPEAGWEAQCLTADARGCSFHVVILSGHIPVVRVTWWRLSVLLSSQIRWLTFTPIVLSCKWKMDHQLCWNALVLWRRLQQQPHFLLSADASCTTSSVRERLGAEAPTLGEIHGRTWVWNRVQVLQKESPVLWVYECCEKPK